MPYVMVAVPAELLPKIAELVAQYTGEPVFSDRSDQPVGVPTGTEAQSANGAADLINGWTAAALRRAYNESGDGMRGIFEYLAANAGRELSSRDVADNVESMKDWNSVAGALGAFGRRSSNRYGLTEQPWSWRYDADDRVLMKMPAAVAEVIKKAAAE